MKENDYFEWWRQAPFACALFRCQAEDHRMVFVSANAVFQIVTGLTSEQLSLSQPEDFNTRAVFFSKNTALHYQVHSYAPEPDYLLVILQQMPNLHFVAEPSAYSTDPTPLVSLLLELSQQFTAVEPYNLTRLINKTLAKLGTVVSADRVYIFDYDFNKNSCFNTYEWCADGIVPEISNLQDVPLAAIPQWVNAHRQGREMYLPDVPALSDNDALKAMLQPQGIKSLLALPMLAGSSLLGFVGFDSVKKHHYYSEQERILLGVFARMLVDVKGTLAQQRSKE